MNPSRKQPIDGLPEGVKFVRIGHTQPGEFQLTGTGIMLGPRGDTSAADVVVLPQPGYEFLYDIKNLCYQVVQKLGSFDTNGAFIEKPETIKTELTFTVSNSADLARVNQWIELAKKLPGFQSIS